MKIFDSLIGRHESKKIGLKCLEGKKFENFSFGELQERSSAIGSHLPRGQHRFGVFQVPGVSFLSTCTAIWKTGGVPIPLFTSLGTAAIETRMKEAGAKAIITDAESAHHLEGVKNCNILVTEELLIKGGEFSHRTPWSYSSNRELMALLFTSGTTGTPKACPVPPRALQSFQVYMEDGIDLRPNDNYLSFASPAWAYGFYYNLIGPLLLGHAPFYLQGKFDAKNTLSCLKGDFLFFPKI